ncbi:hypothetical protein IAQ61_001080 [Plenodomus lingam]|uniref:uncharacterized protein n=1 Tax=Leptosphaeria maculans TaxID=5022 RepID=UPI00332470C1|nr:hypothetical protein IAQ61_001080 [Plenodomus lingam]
MIYGYSSYVPMQHAAVVAIFSSDVVDLVQAGKLGKPPAGSHSFPGCQTRLIQSDMSACASGGNASIKNRRAAGSMLSKYG